MADVDATFTDDSGTARLEGTITGLFGLTGEQAMYSGQAVSIADNAQDSLTWDNLDDGTEVLDRTDPAAPVVLEAGLYFITVTVGPTAPLTADGSFRTALILDFSGVGAQAASVSPQVGAADLSVAVSGAYFIPEAGEVRVRVTNHDGATDRSFGIETALVVRLA